jgi:hypothetical protein
MTAAIGQWEYRVQTLGKALSGPKDEEFTALLNTWGEEGWEIISVTPIEGSNKVRVTAKRPLTTASRRRRSMPIQL